MQGRRNDAALNAKDGEFYEFAPGDYGKNQDGNWWCRAPNGLHGNLLDHSIVEHEDGTITVSPSILITLSAALPEKTKSWHGYLERGVWRSC